MKYWMLVVFCSGLCVVIIVIVGQNDVVDVVVDQVFRVGLEYCNQVLKVSRMDVFVVCEYFV